MKTAIVTVYNTENCGSFLQAYALRKTLEKRGHEVCYLCRDLKGTPNTFKSTLRYSAVKCAKLNFNSAINVWKRHFAYMSANKNQPVVYRNTKEFDDIDCFVIGSDTIWNFNSRYFYNENATYLGTNLPDVKKITYAASAGNTSYEVFQDIPNIKGAMSAFDSISVRDNTTAEIVEKLVGKYPEIVCDPTLLLSEEDYDSITADDRRFEDGKYIFIYHFGAIGEKQKKHILELKRHMGYKLVSFSEYRSWCDINVANNPNLFLTCMKHAAFVVTDTFHGTIFSVIYHKNFADYGGRKLKISDFLNKIGLQNTIVETKDSIIDKFESHFKYEQADKVIDEMRTKSLNYLNSALGDSY